MTEGRKEGGKLKGGRKEDEVRKKGRRRKEDEGRKDYGGTVECFL